VNTGKYNGALASKVWPDHAVFIDWFHDDAYSVWSTGLTDLYASVPYDGLWIDMNEATTFCDGECPDFTPDQLSTNDDTPRKLAEGDIGSDNDWFFGYAD